MTRALALLAAGLVSFAVVHSLLAADRAREWSASRLGLGARAYRVFYNLLATAVLGTALWVSRGPQPLVWRTAGVPRAVLLGLQVTAVLGFLWTLRGFDLGVFLGLRAAPATAPGAGALRTNGAYALCRHPLYFFTSLFFSAWPVMDRRWLVLAGWLWLYAYVGSIFEERRLVRELGEPYRRYRATHPRLLPFGPRGG